MSDLRVIYTTLPNIKTAQKISNQLLSESLIACSNILPGMLSSYFWKAKVVQEKEVILLCKTTKKLALKAFKRIEFLHPYQVPCLYMLNPSRTSKKYTLWLQEVFSESRKR